ncbi:MAG: sarcosine oxidase subunit gamma [Hyphomicrobiales bacterium]|nr:sarcosine oxidase subunit gamma [Hyphomicrobiales bacterium]MCP5002182.1 sarcosine oxidase subunit gamma [Hyphomicrobiales bacterium]
MSDATLKARSPLDGYRQQFGTLEIVELNGLALVSVATPLDGEEELKKAMTTAHKAELPAVGSSTQSSVDDTRFLGLQPGQMFAMFAHDGDRAVEFVAKKLGETGYYTDQSDSWVILQLSGADVRTALERICAIDLQDSAFPVGAVTRTVMEHLGTIIMRTGHDTFVLLSARSSAKSFLHAVLTSVNNIQ